MSTLRPIRLLCFAGVRDLLGSSEFEIQIERDLSLAEFWQVLEQRFPELTSHRGSLKLALNGSYATPQDQVRGGDEVAIIPPVAGG